MNPKAVGEISEAAILAKLVALGKSVSIPFGNNQRYDYLVDDAGTFNRVQCKTGRIRGCALIFNSCSTNGFTGAHRLYVGEIDYFAVFCPENGQVYLVPISATKGRQANMRLGKEDRKGKKPSMFADDYKL